MINRLDLKDKLGTSRLGWWLAAGWTLIILLLPLHGFLSVWLSSIFGGYLAWRSWKEALIILLLAAGTIWLYGYDKPLLKRLAERRINQLIGLYGLLHLVLIINSGINYQAVLYALVYNLRFLGFFLLAQIIGHYFKRTEPNIQRLNRIVLWPAAIVIALAWLQFWVLPSDWLTHFGYGRETIEPFVTIDAKDDWVRAQSTLRGPNQLGQYLLLPLILLTALWLKRASIKNLAGVVAGGAAMISSFSRSAWLGLVAALGSYFSIFNYQFSLKKAAKPFLIGLTVLGVAIVGILQLVPNSENLRLIIFHDDQVAGDAADSNQIRVDATKQSLQDIADSPIGYGPGYAGPASFHNEFDTKINENYYLQIALEVGVMGLLLFAAINWLAVLSLWRQKQQIWPRVLLAVFVGIALINFFLPAWAQDEIALFWWGLAGLFYRK